MVREPFSAHALDGAIRASARSVSAAVALAKPPPISRKSVCLAMDYWTLTELHYPLRSTTDAHA